MKRTVLCLCLILALLTLPACGMREVEQRLDVIEDKLEASIEPKRPSPAKKDAPKPEAKLSSDEASAIALEHAGLGSDEVSALRSELDYDDGRVEYEISFRHEYREYEYEINADSGDMLSFDLDD